MMDYQASLSAILPVLIVMVTGMGVILVDSCVPAWRQKGWLTPALSLIGLLGAMVKSLSALQEPTTTLEFNGAILNDTFSLVCYEILLVTGALAVLLATTYLKNRDLNLGEYYGLVLFATSGAMLMAAANDLIVLFVALEILSVALYVLTGFARTERRSEEAALKYFLLGAFAAGFLLFGIALIYGGSSTTTQAGTTQLNTLLAVLRQPHLAISPMLVTGIALLLVGLGFKAALVPFHMWTPDVYEGAPTSVTAFMAACAKIGAFAAILRIAGALAPISNYWMPALQILAVLTMFGGNILAVTQTNVKRMLAYSSIAHAGYLAVAVCVATSESMEAQALAYSAIAYYLLAYTLMTMGAFGVLIWLSRRGQEHETLEDLKGLARMDPAAAYLMLIFMLSLGGIPPTMGFLGKWLIFNAAVSAGLSKLAIALALASVISIYYYLKVVWMMCFQEPEPGDEIQHAYSPFGVQVSVFVTAALSLILGIIPNLLSIMPNLMEAASSVVRP